MHALVERAGSFPASKESGADGGVRFGTRIIEHLCAAHPGWPAHLINPGGIGRRGALGIRSRCRARRKDPGGMAVLLGCDLLFDAASCVRLHKDSGWRAVPGSGLTSPVHADTGRACKSHGRTRRVFSVIQTRFYRHILLRVLGKYADFTIVAAAAAVSA